MDIKQIYMDADALLKGHFKLSSGNHSNYYLQSAKVLENPKTANLLAQQLAKQIKQSGIKIDTICSPALGGLIAGFALAQALDCRYIFAERVDGAMTIRRGFEIKDNEQVLICEDIITTGVVAFAALANRGFCHRQESDIKVQPNCKLPQNKPLFALADFTFEMYPPNECPLCKTGSKAIKPGSRS